MPQLTQRHLVLAQLIIYSVLILALAPWLAQTYGSTLTIVAIVASVLFGCLSYAYWRGWEQARYMAVVILLLVSLGGMPVDDQRLTLPLLIVPLLTLILAGPAWVVAVSLIQIIGLALKNYFVSSGQFQGAYGLPTDYLIYVMAIVAMVLSRLMLDTALREAQANARQASEARDRAEAHAADLARQTADLARKNDEQSRLLELVSSLETPAVALADGVLLAPIVGNLDSRRAAALTSRLLNEVSTRRTRHVVLDIAGVAHVDTEVAQALYRAVQALRLLGCEVTITGISAPVAASLTHLGIGLSDVRVARSPQEVLNGAK